MEFNVGQSDKPVLVNAQEAFSRDIHNEVFEATSEAVAQGVTHRHRGLNLDIFLFNKASKSKLGQLCAALWDSQSQPDWI